ncbi:MAG: hypothetical protein F9K16_02425 [Thermoanaerobaculia bacterium]|nr:MAG: hypothetical protein F9K16_02425 [Thermoanaerobaculia bacterium]MBZ0103805.1 hypothetical protein [Thermoanaerobaculia bacterium]
MNCFYHPSVAAAGLCKSCQRGICPECAVELPRGLACRKRCEEDARLRVALEDRNLRLAQEAAGRARRQRVGLMVGGLFVALFGVYFLVTPIQGLEPLMPFRVLAASMVSYGVAMIVRGYIYEDPAGPERIA